jgi:hypothetical protein
MDIGSGIALASVACAGGGVAITAIRSFAKNGKSNGHCPEHSGVCQSIDGFEDWLTKIENKLDRVIEGRVGK